MKSNSQNSPYSLVIIITVRLVRFLLPNVVKQWCRKVISIGVAKKTIRAEIAEKSIIIVFHINLGWPGHTYSYTTVKAGLLC